MKFVRLTVLMLLAVFVFGLTTANATTVRITQPKLKALKISLARFRIMNISQNGNIVTGLEKVSDKKKKKKGTVYKLWVFDFSGKSRSSLKTSEILIPCSDFDNATLTHDGKICLIIAERGSKFIKVDLPTKKVTTLFEHKKGNPGFRCDTGEIQTYYTGKIGATGYFYDEKDQIRFRAITYIDPNKTGASIFTEAININEFELKLGNRPGTDLEWVELGQCFWMGRINKTGNSKIDEKNKVVVDEKNKTKNAVLCYWDRGKNTILDEAKYFIHFAAGKDKIIYTVVDNIFESKDGKTINYENPRTYIIDKNKNRIQVNPSNKLYQNLAMSKNNGSTAIITDRNMMTTTDSYYYGKEANGFKMVPVDGQTNTPMSVIRLSANGNAYVTWDGFQITWGELK